MVSFEREKYLDSAAGVEVTGDWLQQAAAVNVGLLDPGCGKLVQDFT